MNRARLFLRTSSLTVRMSCTAASNRTLEGKVAVVTASTEGYVAFVRVKIRGVQYHSIQPFRPVSLVVISEQTHLRIALVSDNETWITMQCTLFGNL